MINKVSMTHYDDKNIPMQDLKPGQLAVIVAVSEPLYDRFKGVFVIGTAHENVAEIRLDTGGWYSADTKHLVCPLQAGEQITIESA